MKKVIVAIFCILIVNISFSQSSDAEYNKIIKEYTLNTDGSIDYHYTKSLVLNTHFAFHRLYGETFIIYNTDFQKLKINSSYTIMADGKKIVTPSNAYNEVLPRFSNNAPAYNNIREMVVTHTGLEVGSTINLDYTLSSEAGFYPTLMGDELLAESSPVKEMIIRVKIPENDELNYSLINIIGEPEINNDKGKKVYTWTFNSLPATSKEYFQENYQHLSPRLMFSTEDLQTVYNNFVNQDAFNYMTNESMTKTVTKVLEDETNELDFVLALQKIVANNLANLNVPLKYTGYKCRNSIQTWNSNQGTKLEKAILLSALLQKADIQAVPIALTPSNYFNKSIGNLLTLKDIMIKVSLKRYGDLYLSTNKVNSQNQILELSNMVAFNLDKNNNKLKITDLKTNTGEIVLTGEFDLQDNNKLLGNITLELRNQCNPYFKIYNDSAAVKSMISGIISKEIKSFEIEKLFQELSKSNMTVDKENPTVKQGNYYSFSLPMVSKGIDSWHMNLLTAERNSSLEVHGLIYERYEYAIVLSDGSKMVTKPTLTVVDNEVGAVTVKIEKKDNEVIVIREITLKKKIISATEYPKFKKIMDIWNNDNYRKIIYKD